MPTHGTGAEEASQCVRCQKPPPNIKLQSEEKLLWAASFAAIDALGRDGADFAWLVIGFRRRKTKCKITLEMTTMKIIL